MANKKILVDSRATDNFIHPKFVKCLRMGMQELECPMKIWNIDGMTNKAGKLMHFVNLLVQTKGQEKKMRFLVTDLGVKDVILRYPWLSTFKPQFSWKDAAMDTNILPVIIRSPDSGPCLHIFIFADPQSLAAGFIYKYQVHFSNMWLHGPISSKN